MIKLLSSVVIMLTLPELHQRTVVFKYQCFSKSHLYFQFVKNVLGVDGRFALCSNPPVQYLLGECGLIFAYAKSWYSRQL